MLDGARTNGACGPSWWWGWRGSGAADDKLLHTCADNIDACLDHGVQCLHRSQCIGPLVDAALGFHSLQIERLMDGLHCPGRFIKAGGQLCHLTLLNVSLLRQVRLCSTLLVQELLKCWAKLPRPFQHPPTKLTPQRTIAVVLLSSHGPQQLVELLVGYLTHAEAARDVQDLACLGHGRHHQGGQVRPHILIEFH